jgi:hypothetical protein
LSKKETTIEWSAIEDSILQQALVALAEWPTITSEPCSFFAFSITMMDGMLYLFGDTPSNAREKSQKHLAVALEQRRSLSHAYAKKFPKATEPSLDWVNLLFDQHPVNDYSQSVSDFAHTLSVREYPLWREGWDENEESAESAAMLARIKVTLWRVITRIIQEPAFALFPKAYPFRIGYEQQHTEQVVPLWISWNDSTW